MQESSPAFQQVPAAAATELYFPEHERLTCPRCESTNTKFCYFNNYNLSQPRHFCKSCKRYWTKGGSLRNIPVGGTTRKPGRKSNPAKKQGPGPNPKPDWQQAEGHGGSGAVAPSDQGDVGSCVPSARAKPKNVPPSGDPPVLRLNLFKQ